MPIYYKDTSVLLENIPLVKFIKTALFCLCNKKNITRRLEDLNFIFSWQKQYYTTRCACS